MSKSLRILVLAHASLVPPERPSVNEVKDAEWRVEYDVIQTLAGMGHAVNTMGLYDDLSLVEPMVAEYRPQIVFNLMEEFDGVGFFDQNVVSYLELIKLRYTGCNPRGLMLARDKALTKKILAFHGIQTPAFEVFPRGTAAIKTELAYPLIVKSVNEEASLGISQASIVHDSEKLEERVRFVHQKLGIDAMVERYIEGREIYVGVLGNSRVEAFPVWELVFKNLPDQAPRIATRKAKWDRDYRKRNGISSCEADLTPEMAEAAREVARQAYRVLGLTGYARIDMRLADSGEIFLLEANPNPHIGTDEDFAQSARKAGLSYADLLSRIVNLGMRWKPTG